MSGRARGSRRRHAVAGLLASLGLIGIVSATVALATATVAPQRGTVAPERAAVAPQRAALAPQRAALTTERATVAPASEAAQHPARVPRPHIVWDPIPFGPARRAQMAAYVHRHYGSFMKPTWRLVNPHVIVIHYTVTPDFSSTFNTFAPDVPDSELHELPGTCAHYVIDAFGVIHQLVALTVMCRHTVGLNWTAIGIEHVGYSDAQVLGDRRELDASLHLVRWLRCRFHIAIRNVIGHNESVSSPYHREDVAALRGQTHSDFVHADMQVYRAKLKALGPC